MRIDILSLFPAYFTGPFDESMIGKAREKGLIDLRLVDIRDYAEGKHRQVDDRPYGGGPGMVLMAEPVAKALRAVKADEPHRASRTIYLTPQGKPLTAKRCRELAEYDRLILLCGHYEGVDQRVLDTEIEEEISIGDYVLTNGCLAAIVLVDALARFVPGVIGHAEAAQEESFEGELLDCPHFTRPEVWEGRQVPAVLLQGHHSDIERWRRAEATAKTAARRPDLWMRYRQAAEEQSEPSASRKSGRREWSPETIVLAVSDLKVSRRFYRDRLRLELVAEQPAAATFALGSQQLMLIEGKVGEVLAQFERTEADPERLSGLLSEATGYEAGDDAKVLKIWFTDPDGYQWVVTQEKSF